ncbi:MAG: O-antigen ligase-related protein [candidate division WWE3 bacterium GW2011_GWF2_41_45]|uniref:O-antigen ligase-related protein n=2 Tax=Katanobacteria TaxID=422282 RepID=A0A0G0VPJ0_UNCKA|nr:MAG: O-antigen ligase-related protein [candidate division WWE3 bacterium GW2011_GWC2_41_23]KKS08785.1 MAG: O-antigen ligase-related protein [candidate division WWE3 bacterium GW2011_GWF2_41_45]KKS19469.1 MAG: O-antigen ligase-related protein [candidate division WWE3 bacterium GW2011_GWE1_41_72]KKS27391.1 MAG: O-antigen ligase-related protein [candidate division WWE3 bacterium GW2011_GWC1_42_102]KKS28506.1 MAG: O-antigen ligase-related protein [candidate division WWE3 bacterium GW2011_GWD2_42
MKKIQVSKILFFALAAVLPVNLGKHFEFSGSYVYGNLVDYLVPTLYIQDILALALLLAVIFERKKISLQGPVKKLSIFLGILFLSSLFASRILPSLWFLFRIFLYSMVAVYAYFWIDIKKDGVLLQKILTIQFLFISVLSITQFLVKGSVFDSYLFLGEQPYSMSSPLITKEFFFGTTILPPMGLFRHPNVLAGYLAVMLVLAIFWIPRSRLSLVSFCLGMLALILTFSLFTWAALFLTLVLYKILPDKKHIMYLYLFGASLILLIPFLPFSYDSASFYRRDSLLGASYRVAGEFPLLGVGANNFTSYVDDFQVTDDIRFTQPVHNVFALILAESGVFAFVIFLLIFFEAYAGVFRKDAVPFFLTMSVLLLLMSFDHYFWTMHQTSLLFFLILGLSWKYAYGQRN